MQAGIARLEPARPSLVILMMGEKPNEPGRLDYAGPSTPGFQNGLRGCVWAVGIMLAVAAVLVAMVFAFSLLVRIRRGS